MFINYHHVLVIHSISYHDRDRVLPVLRTRFEPICTVLCDCPGLVFPNFATTKAELVYNGVLPIDHLCEFSGPTTLVAQRIPQKFLESLYGIKIHTCPFEEGGAGVPTGGDLLMAYARARGFCNTGAGNPDDSRAARYVLKDYANGKLLFCHPPAQTLPSTHSI
ncbi:hypothetical protein C7212DRAFT_342959 [Tuber magnatum]|uniref:Uncharacterized protein n=1 Tax=Tuber magnatum TaxID=42249 RepID=A0A317SRT1_9PEZI|nr:hypothetical protein C7212DRAFT_342959 [Tuber magnatum]